MRKLSNILGPVAICLGLSACAGLGGGGDERLPSLQTAQVALKSGAADMALSICRQLSASHPRSLEPLVCTGDAASLSGNVEEARTSYAAALSVDPQAPAALLGMGRLNLPGAPLQAEQFFGRLLALDPRDAIALNNIGIAQDLQGRPDEAQASYARAIAADPSMRAASINLALSLAIQGQAGPALTRLPQHAGGSGAPVRERHDVAALLAMAGRDAEAAELLGAELSQAEISEALSGFRALAGNSR